MQRTKDARLINEKYRAAFEVDVDFSKTLARSDSVALTNDAGFSLFTRRKPGLYTFVVGTDPSARGKAAKDMINDSFSWMFINTDAYVLRSSIEKTNLACLEIAKHMRGYRIEDPGPDYPVKIFTTTLARWAKEYGLKDAIAEIRAAGQSVKADKLEAAAKAAGAL